MPLIPDSIKKLPTHMVCMIVLQWMMCSYKAITHSYVHDLLWIVMFTSQKHHLSPIGRRKTKTKSSSIFNVKAKA